MQCPHCHQEIKTIENCPVSTRDEPLKIRVTDEYLKDLELMGLIIEEEEEEENDDL